MHRYIVFLLITCSSATVFAQKQGPPLHPPLSCEAIPLITARMSSDHIGTLKQDKKFTKRVGKIFADRLDGSEILLTQKEFDKVTKTAELIAAQLLPEAPPNERRSACKALELLRDDAVTWQQGMEKYVVELLADKKLKVDKKRVLELDPKKRPRPKSKRQQTRARRALVDFQLANYLSNATPIEEAKAKLKKRYELATRRAKEVTTVDMYGAYLNAFASALDPHSSYFSPEDMEDFRISMALSLTGIGAVLTSRDGYITIEEIVPGGAADRMKKLKPKDKIVAVAQGDKGDPVDVIDMDVNDVVRLIRGKKGTKVKLSILRRGKTSERFNTTIIRDVIDLKQQAAKLRWHEVDRDGSKVKIAIIDLPSFYSGRDGRDSATDVKRLLAEATKGGAQGVLLDLSKNGGGALLSAVQISGLFIERGAIVGSNSKQSATPRPLADHDPMVQWAGPVVVLTSRISASASEILAGALQDYRRAVIVGDKQTFGKGSVQQIDELPPGWGANKVTSALFFLPGGESTQHTGVASDITIPSPFSKMKIGEKYEDFAIPPATAKPFLSDAANASKQWKPVPAKVISKLRSNSKKRVAKNKEYQKEKKKYDEDAANETKIKIADLLKEVKTEEEREKEAEENKGKLSLQAKEAAEVLADLIQATAE